MYFHVYNVFRTSENVIIMIIMQISKSQRKQSAKLLFCRKSFTNPINKTVILIFYFKFNIFLMIIVIIKIFLFFILKTEKSNSNISILAQTSIKYFFFKNSKILNETKVIVFVKSSRNTLYYVGRYLPINTNSC